ncbi:MAG: sigma-54-dependent Fis family transcriptional regulator [Candidatus Omnitrophica bacterium]|nr:sigma-54-dependent Fis family transcriptional regulator [Candidatus Omnitrophota bacterium]
MATKRILIAEDEPAQLKLILRQLRECGYEVEGCLSAREALQLFRTESFDLIITDYKMSDMSGIDFLCEIKRLNPGAPVIFMTGYGTIDLAVSAMKKGAFDFLTKPFSFDVLIYTVRRAFQVKFLEEENVRLHMELMDRFSFDSIVGGSPPMKALFKQIVTVSMSDATCLIEGESGTGKEIIARAIHYEGLRKSKPFVVINCAAIPENLLESEMFGHERGAFVGAMHRHIGKFEQANGGTLFLDEVGDMPLSMQGKILRVLAEKQFEKIGGTKPVSIDVRVIASSNRPLADLVQKKEFREDLYYRLNVVPIHVPTLRERKEDIPLLIRHFLTKYSQPHMHVAHDVVQMLMKYDWPGNVRELENIIERMLIMSSMTKTLHVSDVPMEIRESILHPGTKKAA